MAAYVVLGAVIISSVAGVPAVARFSQKYMNRILGPALIGVGLFLLGVLRFGVTGFSLSGEKQNALADSGVCGAFILGVVFALSFCPISAALFFGSLIPLTLRGDFGMASPIMYGAGTALPVFVFAVGLSLGVHSMAHWFNKVVKLESYMRKITGLVFIIGGAYYSWMYIVPVLRARI
jgi:cytochrome c biogenesis protein CcdA